MGKFRISEVSVLGLTGRVVIYPPLDHPVWLVPAFLIGACIGSFLNVVIYRLPLGLSVNDPKRSFCPKCKSDIPMRQNIPLISWLALKGKCSNCQAPIASRVSAKKPGAEKLLESIRRAGLPSFGGFPGMRSLPSVGTAARSLRGAGFPRSHHSHPWAPRSAAPLEDVEQRSCCHWPAGRPAPEY